MSLDLSDADRKALAADVAEELDTGRYGDRFVLSRRQLLSIAGGSAGVAGLTALGVDPATAQSAAGQVGTEASPEDVFAYDLDVQNGAEFNGADLSGVGSLSTGGLTSTGYIRGEGGGDKAIHSIGDDFVGVAVESYRSAESDHAIWNSYAARGTQSSPSAIQSGDIIKTIRPRGYDGSGFKILGDLRAEATENFDGTGAGQKWVFEAVSQGSTSGSVVAEVRSDGVRSLLSGSASSPALQLDSNGAGFFVNSSGEVVVVDESGNTTVLS